MTLDHESAYEGYGDRGLIRVVGGCCNAYHLCRYLFVRLYSINGGNRGAAVVGAVQITMIIRGIYLGERFSYKIISALGAIAGLIYLVLPGVTAPPLIPALIMVGSGVAWGIYSLLGRTSTHAIRSTTGNFIKAVPLSLALTIYFARNEPLLLTGALYAIASGAITSGLGYALWYTVLPKLSATSAAMVQLSVPVLAAFGGLIFLSEALTMRLAIASIIILGGIAIFILTAPPKSDPSPQSMPSPGAK